MANRRRSERYRIHIPVWLKDAQGGERTQTVDVSAHGIAIVAAKSRAMRQYVELEITLPSPSPKISVTAIVARLIEDVELDDASRHRGVGLDFFLFDSKAKAEWQRFIIRLHTEAANVSAIEASSLGGEEAPPEDDLDDEEEGVPTFIIKPRDLGRLWAFYRGELSKGLVRIEAPVAKQIGDPVELLVVHPTSEAEWIIPGKVSRSIEHGRGGRPVLEIAIGGTDQNGRTAFRNFVATGQGMIEEEVHISTDFSIAEELPIRRMPVAPDEPIETRPPTADLMIEQQQIDTADLPGANAQPRSVIIDLDDIGPESEPISIPEVTAPPSPDQIDTAEPHPIDDAIAGAALDDAIANAALEEHLVEPGLVLVRASPPAAEYLHDEPDAPTEEPEIEVSVAESTEIAAEIPLAAPPPPLSPQSLSGRLFASFFFEAAESERPGAIQASPRSVSAASPPAPMVRASKLEAKPFGAPSPPPPPMPVIRGAPLPETLAKPAGPPPMRDREAAFSPYVGPAAVEHASDPSAEDAVIAEAINRPNGARAPARGAGDGARTHRDLSTESEDPNLDRDIALAKARVVRSPNSATACFRLSTLLLRRGGPDSADEALGALHRVMEIEPNHPGAHHALAEVLARRGEYDLAAEHLARARRLGYRIDPTLERAIMEGRRS